MSGIPWSSEAEERLRAEIRRNIAWTWICSILCILTFVLSLRAMWFIVAPLLFLVWAVRCLKTAGDRRTDLGWEEGTYHGARYAGSGMLANKPKDTSRLTAWKKLPALVSFHCVCGQYYVAAEMKWIPNVKDDTDPGIDAPAIDPGGGRYVLICENCGRGYYTLKEKSDAEKTKSV